MSSDGRARGWPPFEKREEARRLERKGLFVAGKPDGPADAPK